MLGWAVLVCKAAWDECGSSSRDFESESLTPLLMHVLHGRAVGDGVAGKEKNES